MIPVPTSPASRSATSPAHAAPTAAATVSVSLPCVWSSKTQFFAAAVRAAAANSMAHISPSRDVQDLRRFGYAQELFRSMGGFSNFAISFSIISILTGAVTLYGYGLEMGGPLEMTLGWPVATFFMLAVAC